MASEPDINSLLYNTCIIPQVGQILDGIDASGLEHDTFVMISSDHGGLLWENMPEPRKGHGGQTDKEMHVPMFLRGKLSNLA